MTSATFGMASVPSVRYPPGGTLPTDIHAELIGLPSTVQKSWSVSPSGVESSSPSASKSIGSVRSSVDIVILIIGYGGVRCIGGRRNREWGGCGLQLDADGIGIFLERHEVSSGHGFHNRIAQEAR